MLIISNQGLITAVDFRSFLLIYLVVPYIICGVAQCIGRVLSLFPEKEIDAKGEEVLIFGLGYDGGDEELLKVFGESGRNEKGFFGESDLFGDGGDGGAAVVLPAQNRIEKARTSRHDRAYFMKIHGEKMKKTSSFVFV